MVKDITSRAKGWAERKSPEKSRKKGELLVWISGLPHLLKLSQRERSLQPKGVIIFKIPPVLKDYLTNCKRIAHDQHATAEDCSSAPCGHCALCGSYGKHHSMIERKIISALRQEESSWPNVCLVQTMGFTWPLVCFAKNNMWDKLKISFPSDGPFIGTIGINPQEKRRVLWLNITPWSTLP